MRHLFILISFLTGLSSLLTPLRAESAASQAQAASLFQEGKYEEALKIWYASEEQGQISAGLYYNIGLAESRQGHTFEAMLGFEKAYRLKPMGKAIVTALHEGRKRIDHAIIPVEPFFLITWYKGFVTLMRPGAWSMVGLLLMLLAAAGFVAANGLFTMPFIGNMSRVRFAAIAGLLCLLMAVLSYREIYRDDEAIIRLACEFRQAPAEDSPSKRVLSPGEKIIITDQIGDWYRVRLLNLDEGWIHKQFQVPVRVGQSVSNP